MLQKLIVKNEFNKRSVDCVPFGYAYHKIICDESGAACDYKFLKVNRRFEELTGLTSKQLVGKRVSKALPDLYQHEFYWIKAYGEVALDGDYKEFEEYSKSLGKWYRVSAYSPRKYYFVTIFMDITEYKTIVNELNESQRSKAVLLANLPGLAYRCKYDRDWTMLFVSEGCCKLTGYNTDSLIKNKDISYDSIIAPQYRKLIWEEWQRVVKLHSVFQYEYAIITATGESKWVYEQGQPIYDSDGKVEALEGLIIDITDRKKREIENEYLHDHDLLTGVYNRRFFDKAKNELSRQDQLPISVIIGDINGLKLINDAFGHANGDMLIKATTSLLSGCCRKSDILSRIGGDEFCMLLPNTDNEEAYDRLNEIWAACREYNRQHASDALYSVNISLGYSTKQRLDQDIELVINNAEDFMLKRKLLESKSSHSAIISSIKATMLEKSLETEKHAERLGALSKKMGIELGLSQSDLDDLELLSTLHDIGKVGIDERILNKPGPLSKDEWRVMKQHPEIGYRIAMSSPDLAPVAKYILHHHEHWNGKGYPHGLEREKIPLLSRILSIADAYDAMTQDRPYRKAMDHLAAVSEIEKNAGVQFDPDIARVFIEHVAGVASCV